MPGLEQSPNIQWQHHPELYLQDGNLILLANETLFRVHAGLLAVRSCVFAAMLSPEYLEGRSGRYDDCILLSLPDNAKDLEYFLKAIMGLLVFEPNQPMSFPATVGVLRLARKYEIDTLETQAKKHFGRLIPTDFEAIGNEESLTSVFGESDPPHFFTILEAFDEFELKAYRRWAFYKACSRGFDALLKGERHNGKHIKLDRCLTQALTGWKKLITHHGEIRRTLALKVASTCTGRHSSNSPNAMCGYMARLTVMDLAIPANLDTEILKSQSILELLSLRYETPLIKSNGSEFISEAILCKDCAALWLDRHRRLKEDTWNSLSSYFF